MDPTDDQVVTAVLAGNQELFEVLIRRYNQRLYRVIRGVLTDEAEIEDVIQQAYVNAYVHLAQFEGRAMFSTWLTKIALYEALSRARRAGRTVSLDAEDEWAEGMAERIETRAPDPERQALAGELHDVLEHSIERLPPTYRSVFILREVEGLSTSETAEILSVGEDVVKTRLHRARGMLREKLLARAGAASASAFTFHASRCDRIVERVFAALRSAIRYGPSPLGAPPKADG